MLIYSIVYTLIMIIDLIIIAINIYRIAKKEEFIKSCQKMIHTQAGELELLNETMELMADDLTTDYHSKEWVIQHYMSEARNKWVVKRIER